MALFTGPDKSPAENPLAESLGARLWTALSGRLGVARRGPRLRLCERLSLGEKHSLALVECEGQRLLLGLSAGQITLLQQLENKSSPVAEKTEEQSEPPAPHKDSR